MQKKRVNKSLMIMVLLMGLFFISSFSFLFHIPQVEAEDGIYYEYQTQDDVYIVARVSDTTITKAVIPAKIQGRDVVSIRDSAFQGCTQLETITFESGSQLKNIGNLAFDGCSALASITIPSSVESIGGLIFAGCSSLSSIKTDSLDKSSEGNGTYVIGVDGNPTLDGVAVVVVSGDNRTLTATANMTTQITLLDNITHIGNNAFYSCADLKTITLTSEVPPVISAEIGSSPFDGSGISNDSVDSNIYVPIASTIIYRTTIGWEDYKDIISPNPSEFDYPVLPWGDFEYSVESTDDDGNKLIAITKINTNLDSYVISHIYPDPAEDVTYHVEEIGGIPSQSNGMTSSIVLMEGIKVIGEYAFYNYYNLVSITIPNSVESIGISAFEYCYNLPSIEIPSNSGIKSIGRKAFPTSSFEIRTDSTEKSTENGGDGIYVVDADGSPTLNGVAIVIVSGDERILSFANKVLNSFSIPENVTKIGDYAFSDFQSLSEIILPNGVTSIGNYAFFNCSKLKSITIPANVKSIGDYAFGVDNFTSSSLEFVRFQRGSQLEDIGFCAFCGCSVKSITIPDGVISIGSAAFSNCSELTEVTLMSTAPPELGVNVFPSDISEIYVPLASVNLYKNASSWSFYSTKISVTPILSWGDFEYTILAESINGDNNKKKIRITSIGSDSTYVIIDHVYEKDGITYYAEEIGNGESTINGNLIKVILMDGIETINDRAFYGCSNLASIEIPNSVVSIGNYAFYGCSNLASIEIPNTVEFIGDGAFGDCAKLEEVIFQEGVQLKTIKDRTFYGCSSLLEISIPRSVITVEGEEGEEGGEYYNRGAFNGCSSLTTVIFEEGSQLETIGSYAFSNCYSLIEIVIPNKVKSIGNYAFSLSYYYDSSLRSITFENDSQLEVIGNYAFSNCYNLISINIPASVRLIGSHAFYCEPNTYDDKYSSLESVTFENDSQLEVIGDYAFSNCYNLISINIPASMRSIGNDAFHCNRFWGGEELYSKLESVTFEGDSQLESIGDYAFGGCVEITSMIIPASVKSIGAYAFYNCTKLKEVIFQENSQLKSIGESAFGDCVKLISITIPNSVTSIGEAAFLGCIELETVTFQENSQLEDLAYGIFAGCESLEFVNIPDSVTSICLGAFWGCEDLTSINLPEGLRIIEMAAFAYSGLTSIRIPASVIFIDGTINITDEGTYYYGAFSECKSLESVIFEENSQLEFMGTYTFYGCSALTTITIPSGVTSIGKLSFYGCSNLQKVILKSITPPVLGSDAFNLSGLSEICVPTTSVDVYKNAFGWSSYSTKIFKDPNSAPSSVDPDLCPILPWGDFEYEYINLTLDGHGIIVITKIDTDLTSFVIDYKYEDEYGTTHYVFCVGGGKVYNENEELVIISEPLTIINKENIERIILSEGILMIGESAFSGCSNLTSISIPDSVGYIGESAFYHCSSLRYIIIPDRIENIQDRTFEGCSSLEIVHIPVNMLSIRRAAFALCSRLTYLTTLINITKIEREAFYGCSSLRSITIPSSVTSIGSYAFYGCTDLETVTFGVNSQLTSIGSSAFNSCSSLTSITIPRNVKEIGLGAFSGCVNLENIFVGEGNNYYCSLDGVLFNKDMTILVAYPAGKTAEEYRVPDSVLSISGRAFYRCLNLKSIIISKNVSSIGSQVIEGCSKLKTIKLTSLVPPLITDGYFIFTGTGIIEDDATARIVVPRSVIEAYKDVLFWYKSIIYPDIVYVELCYIDNETGEEVCCEQEVENGESAIIPENAKKTGYEITWSESPENVKEDIRAVATYELGIYSITFESNGGSSVDSVEITYGNLVPHPTEDPVKTGHVFDGWFIDNETFDVLYEFGNMLEEDIVLYAKWTSILYTLTFDSNGGSEIGSVISVFGTSLNISDPIKSGYTFGGWYKDNETFEIRYLADTMPAESATLYARWVYTVIFDSNNDSGMTAEQVLTENQKTSLILNTFVKTGYSFVGWNTKANGTGDSYLDGEEVLDLNGHIGEITLFAQWEANKCTIIFNNNNGVGVIDPQVFIYNQTQSLTLSIFTRVGYTFINWNTKVDGSGQNYESGEEITNLSSASNAVVELYAQWSANIYTMFIVNHIDNVPTRVEIKSGDLISDLPTPEKEGYIFNGWYTQDGVRVESGDEFTFGKDVVLYTKWSKDWSDIFMIIGIGGGGLLIIIVILTVVIVKKKRKKKLLIDKQ